MFDERERKPGFSPQPSFLRKVVAKVRLLPMVIFVSTLTLTVRVGDLWEGVDGLWNGTVSVSEAQAQTQTPAKASPSASPKGPAPTDMAPPAKGAGSGALKNGDKSVAARMLVDDPTLLTQSEIDLLQKLAQRRVEIDKRAKELDTRSALLAAAEKRVDGKISELKALQVTIEGLLKTYDKQQSSKLMSLVKIYETMKPKDAARIFEKLDMGTLLPVVERMKDRSLAPIMAKMNPQRAREVTVKLNQLRKLPKPLPRGG